MKPILLAVLLLISLMSCDFGKKTTPHVIDEKQSPRYIFVLNAKSGYYQNKELTLKDINSVVYFSDRPNRVAGHMELSKFPTLWKGKDDEGLTARCAILSIMDPEEEIVIELSNPTITGNTITFNYKNIPTDFPKKFSACSLFIDMPSIGSKAFAGHARSDFHSLTCSCAESLK